MELLEEIESIRVQVGYSMATAESRIARLRPVIERRGILREILGVCEEFKIGEHVVFRHVRLNFRLRVAALPERSQLKV